MVILKIYNRSYRIVLTNIIYVICAINLTDNKTIKLNIFYFVTGLEELVALRELDLANNCLCEHRDLEPIKALHRLSKACNHRISEFQQNNDTNEYSS